MTSITTQSLLRTAAQVGVAALPLLLQGCNGAYWGNLLVLGLSFGIFYGTLSLGRVQTPSRTQSPDGTSLSQRPPAETNAKG